MDLMKALEIVAAHGFPLIGDIEAPGGSATITSLSPADAYLLRTDPKAFAAKHFGCAVADYEEWIALDGAPLCGARTRAGTLCKNQVARCQLPISEWLARHRSEYCATHGGESS